MEPILGLIKSATLVTGSTTKCMEVDIYNGLMASSTSVALKKIRDMEMVNSSGRMAVNMMVSG
jgi:hypothetical protein